MIGKELKQRVITAFAGLAFLGLIHYFALVPHALSILFFVLYSEMLIACYISKASIWKKILIFVSGLVYLSCGLQGLIEIFVLQCLLQCLGAIFVVDTAAYVFGKMLKGPLLAPGVSPKKTWSGFVAAMLCGGFVFAFFVAPYFLLSDDLLIKVAVGLLFALVVQFGDLLVSFAKRVLGIKDASVLLPGHGGFWDRCDSIFAGAIFFTILKIMLFAGNVA